MKGSFFQLYQQLLHQFPDQQVTWQPKLNQIEQILANEHVHPQQLLKSHIELMNQISPLPAIWEESFQIFYSILNEMGIAEENQRLLAVHKQLSAELSLAATIQQALLAGDETAHVPSDLDIGLISIAARQVSGDFYQIIPHSHGVELCVADIAGKSMPAALFMSMIKFAMESIQDDYVKPHTALKKLNRFVTKHIDPSMFITMFWGDYNTTTHTFYYSSAGHEPALLYNVKQKTWKLLSTNGIALGLSEEFTYTTHETLIEPGDILLLYTDGVIERRNQDRDKPYQMITEILPKLDLDLPANELVKQLHKQILNNYPIEVPDDQTLLLVRRMK